MDNMDNIDGNNLGRVTTGYELADLFQDSFVRVYLSTGIVLTGTLVAREGKYILVNSKIKSQRALINLDNVSSIS